MSFIGTEQFCDRPVFKFRCRMATAKNGLGKNLFSDFSEDIETPSDDAIKVFLRLKPNSSESNDIVVEDSRTLLFKMPPEFTQSRKKLNIPDNYRYTFSHIFPSDVTQGEIFTGCVANHIRDLFAGQHCLLFTYGTTNAGKTFTVLGTGEKPGIIPRTLTTVFKSILGKEYGSARIMPHMFNSAIEVNDKTLKTEESFKRRILSWNPDRTWMSDTSKASKSHATTLSSIDELGECVFKQMQKRLTNDTSIVEYEAGPEDRFTVWISFGEIYNEAIYDLLEPLEPNCKRKQLKLAQDQDRNTYIKGLHHVFVESEEEAYKVLMFGKKNLQVAETGMNSRSSRSHCIFTIKLMKCPNVEHPERVVVSSFSICDLAGAERQKKALNVGLRLKESQNINCSLHVLSRCFSIIRENQTSNEQKLVPFRDSKLTRLFQHALLGKESVTMIVNVNSEKHLCEETQHVLKASAIAKHIVVQPRAIKRPPRVTRNSNFSQFVIKHNRSTLIRWDSCVKPKVPDASTLDSVNETDITDNTKEDKQEKYESLLALVESLKEKLKEEKAKHLQSKKNWRQREDEIRKEMRDELSKMLEKNKEQSELDFKREQDIVAENGKAFQLKRLRLETSSGSDDGMECDVAELEEEIKMQQKQIEGFTDLVNILREEKKELSMDLSSAKIKLSWKERDIENLQKKIEVLGEESELKGAYLELEKTMNAKLKQRDALLDEARNDVLEEMRLREDCEEEIEKLEKELTEKEEEISKLNSIIQDKSQEIGVKTRTLDMACYENEQLEEKLEKYEEQITDLKSKCATFEEELAKKVEEIEALKKQFQENPEAGSVIFQEELDRLRIELNETAEDRNAVKKELDHLRSERDQLTEDRDELQKELNQLRSERDDQSTEDRNELHKELVQLRSECDRAAKSQDELQKQLDQLQSEFDDVADDRNMLREQLDMIRPELNDTVNDLNAVQEQLNVLRSELDQKEADRVVLQEKLDRLRSEHDQAADELQKQLDRLRLELDQKETDRVVLEEQLAMKSKELIACQEDFAEKLENQSQSRDGVKEDLESAKLSLNKLQEELIEKSKQIEELTKVMENVNLKHEQTVQEHSSEVDVLEQNLKKQIQETTRLCLAHEEKNKEIEKIEKVLNNEKEQMEKLRATLKNKEHELECCKNQIIGYQNSVPTLKSEFDRKEKEVAEYKRKCEDLTISIFNLEQENKSFQDNQKVILSKYEEQLKKAKDENEVLKKEVAKLTNTFYKSTPTPKKELEKQIQDLKKELRDVQKQLDMSLTHCKKLQEENDLNRPNKEIKEVFEDEDPVFKTKRTTKVTGSAVSRTRAQSTNTFDKKLNTTAAEVKNCKSASRVRTRRTTKAVESPPHIVISDSDSMPEIKAPPKPLRKKLWDTNSQIDSSTQFDEVNMSPDLHQESPTTMVRRNLRTRHKENSSVKTNVKNLTHSGKCMGCNPKRQVPKGKSMCRKLFTQDDKVLQELNFSEINIQSKFENESPLTIIRRYNRKAPDDI